MNIQRGPFTFLCISTLISTTMSPAQEALVLRNAQLQVSLSSQTGQVLGLTTGEGKPVLAGNEDRYDLEGKASSEIADQVQSRDSAPDRVTFKCLNPALGLRMTKEYRLKDNLLVKQARYETDQRDPRLFRISSKSLMTPPLAKEGHYYVATDEGYKSYSVPFLSAASVKETTPWSASTGNFVFYLPKTDRTFAHYRYRINEQFFCAEALREVESAYIPGGAITALGQAFVDAGASLTMESHYLLLAGDPSDFHRHLLAQAPYTERKDRPVPAWFPKARMFMSDGVAGIGQGLATARETVAKDALSFLQLLREDECLMLFFNHWTTMGDFPYRGAFRYYDYAGSKYAPPVPVETLKTNIKWLKSQSPRLKLGGYALFIPMATTPPYDEHPDWLVHDREGKVEFDGDGTGPGGKPDFSSGYRDYLLEQMEHYVADLGFDWIHIDCGPSEAVNWRTRKVVQSAEQALYYHKLKEIFQSHNAAIVENNAFPLGLWADGAYFECQQPDRWEKKDWRVLGVPGYLAALYRTHRPGVWLNLCYGTRDLYGVRNAFSGMRGWIRGALTWWRDVARSLAHERVIDELLDTRLGAARVAPSWWKLQTDRLETIALDAAGSLLIPVLLHGDQAGTEEISLRGSDLPGQTGNCLFAFDLRLSDTKTLDAFRPVPWQADYMELTGLKVLTERPKTYRHQMELIPLRNYYHILTAVPAWVYTCNGERTAFLLPTNRGVTIEGVLATGAEQYRLSVRNDNRTAQILAFVPSVWKGVTVEVAGKPAAGSLIAILGQRGVLVDLPQGQTEVRVAQAQTAEVLNRKYANPNFFPWRDGAARLFYANLTHRAYEENGKSCLALQSNGPGGGTVDFIMAAKEPAGGCHLLMKGEKSGGRLGIVQNAGAAWTHEIVDDFTGWKEFAIYKENLKPAKPEQKWDATTMLLLLAQPAAGKEIHLANVHLLPARESDLPKQIKPAKRSIKICRTKSPPVIDGYGNDPCWKTCEVATGFFKYGKEDLADAKSEVRMCYDDHNLYVLFDSLEPITALAAAKVKEAQVWLSDHAHLFLDPNRDGINYFEIGVDTAGTVADIKNSPSGADMKWNGEYEVKTGLNWNVGWMMEMRIPFKTLGKAAKDGETWGVTFARTDMSNEFSAWTRGEWNDPAGFGKLIFGGEAK